MFNPLKFLKDFFTGGIKAQLINLAVDAILPIVNQQLSDQDAYDMGTKVADRVAAKLKQMFGQKPGQRVEDALQLKIDKFIAGLRDRLDSDDI